MPRIKITDLPTTKKISKQEMKAIQAGTGLRQMEPTLAKMAIHLPQKSVYPVSWGVLFD